MKMRKTLLIVFLTAVLLVACVGCSGQPAEEPTEATTTQAEITTTGTGATQPEDPAETTTTTAEVPTKGYTMPTGDSYTFPTLAPTTMPTVPGGTIGTTTTTARTTHKTGTTVTTTTTIPTTTTTTRKLTASDCTLTIPATPYVYGGENGARFNRITYSFSDNRDGTVQLTLSFTGIKLPEMSTEFDPMDPSAMMGGAFRIKCFVKDENGKKCETGVALFESISAGTEIKKNVVIATLTPGNYTLEFE